MVHIDLDRQGREPVSVMGPARRVTRLLVQKLARSSRTIFSTVRFGNVLAAQTAVWCRALSRSEPAGRSHDHRSEYVPLLHARREAVHSKASCGAATNWRGTVLLLEMGEQISVEDMVSQSEFVFQGLVPENKEQLKPNVGCRPGEKLVERELVAGHERVEATPSPKCSASEAGSGMRSFPPRRHRQPGGIGS